MIENIGWLLVHSIWQFGLWGLIALISLKCLRRASSATRYATLTGILLLLTLTPVVTWWFLPEAPQPVAHSEPEVTEDVAPLVEPRIEPVPIEQPDWSPDLSTRIEVTASASTDADTEFVGETNHEFSHHSESGQVATWSTEIHQTLEPWLDGIVGVWFAGMLLFSLRPLSGWYTIRRLNGTGTLAVPENLQILLNETAQRLRLQQTVKILQSSLATVPLVTGFLRPVILLPASVVTGLPPEQLQAILAHEMAHIRRYDQLVNLWQTLVETIFFYHPLVWWLSHRIRCERENCCDDLAVTVSGNQIDYSRALLAIEDLRGTSSALVLSAHGGSLSARIRRLVTGEPNDYRPGILGVVAFVMLFVSCTTAFLFWNADAPTVASLEADSTPQTETPMSLEEQAAWDALDSMEFSISGEALGSLAQRRNIKVLEDHSWPEEKLQKAREKANRPIHSADFFGEIPEHAWPHIAKLQSLHELSFVATDLRGKPMEVIGQLKNLRHIDMLNGECFPSDLLHLKNLPELESVEIMLSVFAKNQDEWIQNRGELTAAEQRRFDELLAQRPPERQDSYRKMILAALYTDRAIRELSNLENLRSFKLINIYVTGASIEYLSQLPKLEEIELSVIDFTRENAHALGQVSTLRSFLKAGVDDEILEELSTLSQLEKLETWADGVTGEGIPHLLKLKNLKTLILRDSHLDDAGLLQLSRLPKLEYLNIQYAKGPLSRAGVLAFQENSPNCRLEVDEDLPPSPEERPVSAREPTFGPPSHGLQFRLVALSPEINDELPDLKRETHNYTRSADATFGIELKNVSEKKLTLAGIRYGESYAESVRGKLRTKLFAPHFFEFEFFDRDGKPLPRTQREFYQGWHLADNASVHELNPGESLVEVLRPAKFNVPMDYDLAPGNYSVRVRYRGPSESLRKFVRKHWPDKLILNAWPHQVDSNPVQFSVAERSNRIRPEDLKWGKPVNGLRAALEYRLPPGVEGNPTTAPGVPVGTSLGVDFHVQNVSVDPITFVSETGRQGDTVHVTNERGEDVEVKETFFTGAPIDVAWTLQPGETAQLHVLAPAINSIDQPGRYMVRYTVRFNSRGSKDADGNVIFPRPGDYQSEVDTAETPLVLSKPPLKVPKNSESAN